MAQVTGLGGVFFKARDPAGLGAWYERHLGLPLQEWGGARFQWREWAEPSRESYTVWSPFPQDTTYFAPSSAPFMINYRVDDLDAVLQRLRDAGVSVDDRIEASEFGRFGWATDPEGNRFELWEPPAPGVTS